MLANGLWASMLFANFLVVLVTSQAWSWSMFGYMPYPQLAELVGAVIWSRLGYGLRKGQRSAVYGLVVFTIIGIGLQIYFNNLVGAAGTTVVFWILTIVRALAVLSAMRHWKAFK